MYLKLAGFMSPHISLSVRKRVRQKWFLIYLQVWGEDDQVPDLLEEYLNEKPDVQI